MAALIDRMTEAKIRSLANVGLHADGRGLYLQIRPNARSWIYRFTLGGRTRDMRLGPLAIVSLVKARAKAVAARALVAEGGVDPIEHAKAQAAAPLPPDPTSSPTFEEVAEAYMADRLKRLRSETHRHQWRQTLEDYAYPIIGKTLVAEIETSDILAVLTQRKDMTI
jgi:hypothetical protein